VLDSEQNSTLARKHNADVRAMRFYDLIMNTELSYEYSREAENYFEDLRTPHDSNQIVMLLKKSLSE
jgi:hypothetical protein